MKILCLLAMRGGSKGVKHKNFINLNNKPLFLYTLEQAKKSNLFTHVVASSDSDQILKKISEWPNCVKSSADNLEPHKITFFLYDLATIFHAYWNLGKQDHAHKFIDDSNKIKENAHAILKSLAIVIRNGMKILGVSTPNKM